MGAVTDESALEEIENIAKVFAYEQRMKDYTPVFRVTYQAKTVKKINKKDMGEHTKFIQNISSRILVKGLC